MTWRDELQEMVAETIFAATKFVSIETRHDGIHEYAKPDVDAIAKAVIDRLDLQRVNMHDLSNDQDCNWFEPLYRIRTIE